MTATIPLPSTTNRIAGHLAPAAPAIPIPATPEDRRDLWQETLAAAVLFFKTRLAHRDPDIAERAAHAIIDLEKTRLRHGRDLAGTKVPEPDFLPPLFETTHDKTPPDPERELLYECDEIKDLVLDGESIDDRMITETERAEVERFATTVECRTIRNCFEKLHRKDFNEVLSASEGDQLVREFYLRRRRAGNAFNGTVDLKGVRWPATGAP